MIYTRPFVTGRFIAFAGDSRSSQVSLAVIVLDSFTEEPLQVALRARLKQLPRSVPVRNQSGFFCFEGITTPGVYTLVLEPDRTASDWYYLEPTGPVWKDTFELTVNLPKPDPKSPVETVTFAPKTSYPFPGNATLVRGKVTKVTMGTPKGIGGAIVSTTYQHENPPGATPSPVPVRTLTDSEGEFVLFFKRLPSATQQIILRADKDGTQAQQPVIITEGTTRKGVLLDLP